MVWDQFLYGQVGMAVRKTTATVMVMLLPCGQYLLIPQLTVVKMRTMTSTHYMITETMIS